MEIILLWFFLSLVVSFIGSGKSIGFFFSFILSLLFSPLIGLIIVAFSESKATKELRNEVEKLKTANQGDTYKVPKTDAEIFREDAENKRKLKELQIPEAIAFRKQEAIKHVAIATVILFVAGLIFYAFI